MSPLEIAAQAHADLLARLERIEQQQAEILRRLVEQARPAEMVNQADLARRLGLTPKALSARLARGSELAQLALVVDGRRLWRCADIDGWLESKRNRARLRAVR